MRLLPFLTLCYLLAFIDRANVGMASLQMNTDLGLSTAVFGLGASLFFVGYFLMEVPSNLMLRRFGARLWLCRIMVTWGLVSAAMALVKSATAFYAMRLLLGAAEAGFFPGVVLYLSYWMPPSHRARALALFAVAIPFSSFVGSTLSGLLLSLDGLAGLHGWQWLFLFEGLPTVLLGLACLLVLTDRPHQAGWLAADERAWLAAAVERGGAGATIHGSVGRLLTAPGFWAMVLACCGASAAGSVLGVWQPQLLKSFGLSDLQTGLVNSIPYGIASVLMILWGRHADRTRELRWHTVLPLALIAAALIATGTAAGLGPTVALLTLVLVGAYCFKGPFWSMASGWLSPGTAAVGIAAINAVSNLIGGGLMVNVYGLIRGASGSTALALLPVALLNVASALALLLAGRRASRPLSAA